MNAVNYIFVAIALIFGGGYALDKIHTATKRMAVERIQRGMPSLSQFTNRLTCSKIASSGELVSIPCKTKQTRKEVRNQKPNQ